MSEPQPKMILKAKLKKISVYILKRNTGCSIFGVEKIEHIFHKAEMLK